MPEPQQAGWHREEHAERATDKLLDAAAAAFVERGVSRTSMSDVARIAGCSRGTIYRYFENLHALHLAFVNRTAIELAARVEGALERIEDPEERIVEGIARTLREVRATPSAAVWFDPQDSGVAARLSRRSQAVETLASAFVARLLAGDRGRDARLRAAWLVRVIVSLLALPGASEREERLLIRRFVAPGLLAEGSGV